MSLPNPPDGSARRVAAGPAGITTEVVLNTKKLGATAAALGAVYLSALAPAAQASTVCNEAENSARGGYAVSGGIVDPNPPAFLRGSQMRVGNDASAGLDHAADRSPALRQCGVPTPPGGGGDDGGPVVIS
jgi:hypothetical protein